MWDKVACAGNSPALETFGFANHGQVTQPFPASLSSLVKSGVPSSFMNPFRGLKRRTGLVHICLVPAHSGDTGEKPWLWGLPCKHKVG